MSDYIGEDVDHASVEQCASEAEALLNEVDAWISKTRPDLVELGSADQ